MGTKWRDVPAVVEDLEWLDQSGVGAFEAARRTDFPSAEALEKWLDHHGHYPLWQRLAHRDPVNSHTPKARKEARMSTPQISQPDPVAVVLESAEKSPRARVRSKAAKVRALVAELSLLLEQDSEREEARKEVERLERKLAEAKARLRGNDAPTAVPDGPLAAEVRAWAADAGIECPAKGRVPATVREAYDEAHAESESA